MPPYPTISRHSQSQTLKSTLTMLYTLRVIAIDRLHHHLPPATQCGWDSYIAQLEQTICDFEGRITTPSRPEQEAQSSLTRASGALTAPALAQKPQER
jgi:hypothetical protein